MIELLEWFDNEIEIAKNVGPMGFATVLTLKIGRQMLIDLINIEVEK